MRPWFKKKRYILPLALLALILLVNIGGNNGSAPVAGAPTSSAPTTTTSAAAAPSEEATEEAADEPTEEPSDEATEESEPTVEPEPEPEPKVSKKEKAFNKLSDEQQDAVGSAEDYLDFSGFSKDGLIDQLSSDYGSQYKKKDAKKAVDFLEDHGGVDWKEQAVRSAKSYRETMHFSTQALIDQLDSDYGGQFTHDQAVYGAKHSR